jgi:hypothetical protein
MRRKSLSHHASIRELLDGAFRLAHNGSATLMLALNRFVDFLAVNRDFGGGFDAQPNLVATNVDDGDLDVVADENAFIALAG